ncbi:MAG TPA: serine hydrolase [Candidatus Acidoferrales bacterium]|nr:serine hydrolase [Candidatus Acidoferrales bacterium]
MNSNGSKGPIGGKKENVKIIANLCITLRFLFFPATGFSQEVKMPAYFKVDNQFSDSLSDIVRSVDLDSSFNVGADGIETISFAVVDLTGDKPVLGGVHYGSFTYPASVYKMYVAMQVLKEISDGDYFLTSSYIVKSPNAVDMEKQIEWDPRPVLRDGDTVTINYLLDLMITRSDNSAANCLIDVATRDSINETMHQYGWYGSEVTRKFLGREYEDSAYKNIRGTQTCALHAADFMYRIYANQLVNPWVSMEMKVLLGRQLDTTKISRGLTRNVMFYHKTGWWSYWTNDVGIVDNGRTKYIISCFVPVEESRSRAAMKMISQRVFELIERRHER